MLGVIICENDECVHMRRGPKDASEEPVRKPEFDATLNMHIYPTAAHLVGNQALLSSVVTLIMCRIIALALIYQEK